MKVPRARRERRGWMIPRLRARRWIISFTIGHTSRQDRRRGGNTERKQRRGNANESAGGGGEGRGQGGMPCPGCTRDTGETQKYKSTGRRGLTGSARAGPARREKLHLAGAAAGRPIVSEIASGAAATTNGNGGTAYRGFPFARLSRVRSPIRRRDYLATASICRQRRNSRTGTTVHSSRTFLSPPPCPASSGWQAATGESPSIYRITRAPIQSRGVAISLTT